LRKVILPLLLILLFVGESVFVELLPADIFEGKYILVPRFLLIALLFLTLYGPNRYGLIYSLIFGLLFDVVYTGIIGIYLFMFPIVAYLISKLMKILQTNIFMVSFACLFGAAILEIGVYEMNFLIHKTDMNFSNYLSSRLWPTLILNLGFIILTVYPFKKHFSKLTESLET